MNERKREIMEILHSISGQIADVHDLPPHHVESCGGIRQLVENYRAEGVEMPAGMLLILSVDILHAANAAYRLHGNGADGKRRVDAMVILDRAKSLVWRAGWLCDNLERAAKDAGRD